MAVADIDAIRLFVSLFFVSALVRSALIGNGTYLAPSREHEDCAL